MQNPAALEFLYTVLRDESENAIIRHESAEAIGAIGLTSSLPVLTEFLTHAEKVIVETCEIARDRINWVTEHSNLPPKASVAIDPAPAYDQGAFSDAELVA
jgi:deoxyhypusine monooxygenase